MPKSTTRYFLIIFKLIRNILDQEFLKVAETIGTLQCPAPLLTETKQYWTTLVNSKISPNKCTSVRISAPMLNSVYSKMLFQKGTMKFKLRNNKRSKHQWQRIFTHHFTTQGSFSYVLTYS